MIESLHFFKCLLIGVVAFVLCSFIFLAGVQVGWIFGGYQVKADLMERQLELNGGENVGF